MPIDVSTLDPDPIRQLDLWVREAAQAGVSLPNAFALATADSDGMPSVRFVLLQGLDADGLRFFSNRSSRKGRDLAINPWSAAAFWWPALDRQARVTGPVRLLPEEESLAYWRTRPRGSQLSAAASRQGEEIGARTDLEALVSALSSQHPDDVPLPGTWGGYLLVPERIEFWTSQPDRLHDRIEYVAEAGGWRRRRLQP